MSEDFWIQVISAVAGIAVAAISTWGAIALRRIAQKARFELTEEVEAAILRRAIEAVRYVEEQAHKAVREGRTPWQPNEKHTAAKRRLRERLAGSGLPQPPDIDGLIESVVQAERQTTRAAA